MVWFVLGTPREVRWLSQDEKRAAVARVVANQTGSDREKRSDFKWEQVWSTFKGIAFAMVLIRRLSSTTANELPQTLRPTSSSL